MTLYQGWTMDNAQAERNYQDRKTAHLKLKQDARFVKLQLGEESSKFYLESDNATRELIWSDALDAERQTMEGELRYG